MRLLFASLLHDLPAMQFIASGSAALWIGLWDVFLIAADQPFLHVTP